MHSRSGRKIDHLLSVIAQCGYEQATPPVKCEMIDSSLYVWKGNGTDQDKRLGILGWTALLGQRCRSPQVENEHDRQNESLNLRHDYSSNFRSVGATTKMPLPATGTKTCLFFAFAATEWLPKGR